MADLLCPTPAQPAAPLRGHIPNLDGLRGLAVSAVLLFHVDYFLGQPAISPAARLYHEAVSFGWCGVDLFFVLSGFLITGILYDSINRADYYRRFYARRTLRIFPLYYGFLIGFFGLLPAALLATGHVSAIATRIHPDKQLIAWLYAVNWFGGTRHFNALPQEIQHFWSLAVEEQFYLAWPLVIRSFERRTLKRICAILVLMSLGWRLMLLSAGLNAAAYAWTICRLDGLALGSYIALCARDGSDWRWLIARAPAAAAVSTAILLILAVATVSGHVSSWWVDAFGATLFAWCFGSVLIIAVQPGRTRVGGITSYRPLRTVGTYSYGLYVLHQPIIVTLRGVGFATGTVFRAVHSEALALLVVNALPIFVAAIAALISWHVVERPFLRLKDSPSLNAAGVEAASSLAP